MQITSSELRAELARCPICGPSLFIKLADEEMAVRCVRCRASPVTLSLVGALQKRRPELGLLSIYELSSQGPLVRYLKKHAGKLTVSEFFEDVAPGNARNGIRCEDVQRLTWPANSFDVCTSTEVFEHVADDVQGFAEVRRVLRPNGIFVFTVPLSSELLTVTRARMKDGVIEHLLEPEYHGDRIRGAGKVLVFRNYGRDILARLLSAGFSRAEFVLPQLDRFFGFGRIVVVGHK